MKEGVRIVEVSPRDGWQNIDAYIPLDVKIRLVDKMVRAGIKHIQLGSFVSPENIPQMRETGGLVKAILEIHPTLDAFALVPNRRGLESAMESGLRKVTWVISVSESHNMANINRTVSESFTSLHEAHLAYPDINIILDAATSFACPFEGKTPLDSLLKFVDRGLNAGANIISLCDTIGMANPVQVEQSILALQKEFPGIQLEMHIHDTRNMGMLNCWVAIQNGVTAIQSSLGGLGGCPFTPGATGNTATEDLVYLLHDSGHDTGIDFDALLNVAKEMYSLIGGNYSGHQISICDK